MKAHPMSAVLMVAFLAALITSGTYHYRADDHPADGSESLRWRTDNRRWGDPRLYSPRGQSLLRKGWKWFGIAGLLLIPLAISITLGL